MTAAPATDRRSIRAAGIVANGDIIEIKPGLWHVTDRSGSGREHVVTKHTCTCEDKARHPDFSCKHQRSVAMKQAAERPTCPDCGAATEANMYYVSGTYRTYRVCSADKYHQATRLT